MPGERGSRGTRQHEAGGCKVEADDGAPGQQDRLLYRGCSCDNSPMSKEKLLWKKRPEADDYRAAASFLSLTLSSSRANALVRLLRTAPITERSAKDLLRASGLPLLPRDELSVREDLKKIAKGKPLSPVLLVRGDMSKGFPLVVADGYHRICAVFYFDERAPVACQIAKRG